VPHTTERAELIGFVLTHSLLRNELPRLAAALAGGDMTSDEEVVVEDQLRLVTDHLLRHHQEEDEFHWPLLVSRAPGAARLLALLEAEHTEMDPLVDRVRDLARSRRDRAVAMSRLSELVLAHLEVEDRSVVPLLAVHVTAEEQRASMERSRAKIPRDDELRVLAMMLAAADEGERARMLAPLPDFVVSAWAEDEAPALTRLHRVLADVAGRPRQGARS
jgi:hemerythrin-like domain-containing protein